MLLGMLLGAASARISSGLEATPPLTVCAQQGLFGLVTVRLKHEMKQFTPWLANFVFHTVFADLWNAASSHHRVKGLLHACFPSTAMGGHACLVSGRLQTRIWMLSAQLREVASVRVLHAKTSTVWQFDL